MGGRNNEAFALVATRLVPPCSSQRNVNRLDPFDACLAQLMWTRPVAFESAVLGGIGRKFVQSKREVLNRLRGQHEACHFDSHPVGIRSHFRAYNVGQIRTLPFPA